MPWTDQTTEIIRFKNIVYILKYIFNVFYILDLDPTNIMRKMERKKGVMCNKIFSMFTLNAIKAGRHAYRLGYKPDIRQKPDTVFVILSDYGTYIIR